MISLCWPECATVADAWFPAFPDESSLVDYEPIRGGRALASVSLHSTFCPETQSVSLENGCGFMFI